MKKTELKAPVAKKIVRKLEKHDDVRIDNYFWLRERDEPDVLEYLNEENRYFKEMTADTKDFQENLFLEMKQRIKEDDSSVPYKYNGYWYITKFEKGKNYPVYFRRKDAPDAPLEEMFDVNEMAGDSDFYSLSGISISPDNRLAAFAVDDVGRRNYTIRIKDLHTKKLLPEEITCTTGGSTWASDNKTLFYARKDEETLRSNEIYRHILGEQPKGDKLVFKEYDETFHSYVYKSKSRKYIIIGSDSTLTSEYRILKADDPHGEFKIVQPRIRGLEYTISHFENDFYILTNKDGAVNFKLMKTSAENTTMENWTDVIPHNPEVLLEDMDIFKDFLVLSERKNGL
ncbi:MAG TPA: oligopeptidase B, partial [Salinimicrobium sp.]|nr:oligopeptidase B [Salinimicrobium sp.]